MVLWVRACERFSSVTLHDLANTRKTLYRSNIRKTLRNLIIGKPYVEPKTERNGVALVVYNS